MVSFEADTIDVGVREIGGTENAIVRIFGNVATVTLGNHVAKSFDEFCGGHLELSPLEDKAIADVAKNAGSVVEIIGGQDGGEEGHDMRKMIDGQIDVIAHTAGRVNIGLDRHRRADGNDPGARAVWQRGWVETHQRTTNGVVSRIDERGESASGVGLLLGGGSDVFHAAVTSRASTFVTAGGKGFVAHKSHLFNDYLGKDVKG